MKKTPDAAISSFSVIVERDALAPMTRPFVCPGLGRVVATSAGYRGAERDTAAAARAATSTAYAASARDAHAPASVGSSRPSTMSRNARSCLGTGGSPPWSVVSADRTPSAQCTSIRRLRAGRAPAQRVGHGRTVRQCPDDLGDLDELSGPVSVPRVVTCSCVSPVSHLVRSKSWVPRSSSTSASRRRGGPPSRLVATRTTGPRRRPPAPRAALAPPDGSARVPDHARDAGARERGGDLCTLLGAHRQGFSTSVGIPASANAVAVPR